MAGNGNRQEAGRRASPSVVAARVADLGWLRLEGATRRDAAGHVRAMEAAAKPGAWRLAPGEPPLSASQVRRYLKKADEEKEWHEWLARERETWKLVARLDRLYAHAVQADDLRAALAVLKYEARLLGLYPGQRR